MQFFSFVLFFLARKAMQKENVVLTAASATFKHVLLWHHITTRIHDASVRWTEDETYPYHI